MLLVAVPVPITNIRCVNPYDPQWGVSNLRNISATEKQDEAIRHA